MGDFLMGNEKNQGYVDGKPIFFDYCKVNWLYVAAVNAIVEELGYEDSGKVKLYWYLRSKVLGDSGALRCIC
jgi:hypothetical protein